MARVETESHKRAREASLSPSPCPSQSPSPSAAPAPAPHASEVDSRMERSPGESESEASSVRDSPPPPARPKARTPAEKRAKGRKARVVWSLQEDVSIIQGILKYGTSWTKILNDQNLEFDPSRTRPLAVRDRLRIRFPRVYDFFFSADPSDAAKLEYLAALEAALTASDWDLEAHPDTQYITTKRGHTEARKEARALAQSMGIDIEPNVSNRRPVKRDSPRTMSLSPAAEEP